MLSADVRLPLCAFLFACAGHWCVRQHERSHEEVDKQSGRQGGLHCDDQLVSTGRVTACAAHELACISTCCMMTHGLKQAVCIIFAHADGTDCDPGRDQAPGGQIQCRGTGYAPVCQQAFVAYMCARQLVRHLAKSCCKPYLRPV